MFIKFSTISNPSDLGYYLTREFPGRYFANQPVGQYSTAGTAGVADHLVVAENSAQIERCYRLSAELNLPVRVVGGGSGILISDVGCPGLVIINRARGLWFDQESGRVLVESGVTNRALAIASFERELGRAEFLYGVPGTIGGAVATGAGFDGQSVTGLIREVTVIYLQGNKPMIDCFSADKLQLVPWRLGWQNWSGASSPAILSVKLQLSRLPQLQIDGRMKLARQEVGRQRKLGAVIGYCFRPPETVDEWQLARKLRLPNLRLVNSRVAAVIGRGVTSRDLRRSVDSWRTSIERLTGQSLERRLDYLGYWPDDDQANASEKSKNSDRRK